MTTLAKSADESVLLVRLELNNSIRFFVLQLGDDTGALIRLDVDEAEQSLCRLIKPTDSFVDAVLYRRKLTLLQSMA